MSHPFPDLLAAAQALEPFEATWMPPLVVRNPITGLPCCEVTGCWADPHVMPEGQWCDPHNPFFMLSVDPDAAG